MLPRRNRLTTAQDFQRAIRGGRRQGSRTLVAHVTVTGEHEPARVGFAVGKQVGNSVVRHRVVRRLRHAVLGRLGELPEGTLLVVRATPAAAAADSARLAGDLDKALTRLQVVGDA